MRAIIITGIDSHHIGLVNDLIDSYRLQYGQTYSIGVIAFDQTTRDSGLDRKVDWLVDQSSEYGEFQGQKGYYVAYIAAKARLPELFPGYDVYCWVDADCWFCNSESLPRIFANAKNSDIAIHPEYDIHYWKHSTPTQRTIDIYRSIEGTLGAELPLDKAMVNTGVFAMMLDSPVWLLWKQALLGIRNRPRPNNVHFSDQIPLHKILHTIPVRMAPLRAIDNWQLYAAAPKISIKRSGVIDVLAPTRPFENIGILHLAGATKRMTFKIANMRTTLHFSALQKIADRAKATSVHTD